MEQLNKRTKNLTNEEIQNIKEKYDNTNPVPKGTKGIVDFVDDIGTIHMKWETGSSLGLIVGVDEFKVIGDVDK